jgi:hypothetical protein
MNTSFVGLQLTGAGVHGSSGLPLLFSWLLFRGKLDKSWYSTKKYSCMF